MLIKCPECQKDVSDTAPNCPGCGFVLKPAAPVAGANANPYSHLPSYRAAKRAPAAGKVGGNGCLLWLGVVAVIVVVVIAIGAVLPSPPSQPGLSGESPSSAASVSASAADEENPEHKANFGAIAADMARIYNSLRDQNGVKWGAMTGTRNGTTLCGSVNAHNNLGGYTGQRRFIFNEAVGDPGVPLGGGAYVHWQEHGGFAREWNRLCRGDPNAVTYDGQLLAGQVEALAPFERESGQ